MYRISIAVFICLVCGCKMGPDYQRPALSIPDSFIYEPNDARDTANTDWWKDFHDPVLDSLITEALANNKTVKIAAANVEQAAAILTQTRASLFPQAAYSGGGARQRANELSAVSRLPGFSNPQDSYEVLAGASWEIDFWGRIQRLSEAARADLLASQEARRGVILSLVASVADSYIQLRGLDEQLATARRNLDTYAQSVRLFDLQYQHGQVTKMTLEQARTQYETAAAVIPQLESQIAQTENAICVLLGRNPGSIQRGKSISELAMPVIPAGLPSELLDRRPDLAQAQQNLIAANARIGAAKALYFPTISLTGAYGTQSSELSDLFSGPSRTWNYTGSVTGPIFTAGSISGQVKQAQAAQAAALLNYENVILVAFSDVENALVACQRLADQLQAQGKLVGSLKEYDRLAWLQYDEGYTPYLTVLNAESQLFNAELSYVQNRTDALASYVRIYQAMGGGWITNAEQLADAQ